MAKCSIYAQVYVVVSTEFAPKLSNGEIYLRKRMLSHDKGRKTHVIKLSHISIGGNEKLPGVQDIDRKNASYQREIEWRNSHEYQDCGILNLDVCIVAALGTPRLYIGAGQPPFGRFSGPRVNGELAMSICWVTSQVLS